MSRILITGGAGFVGSHLAEACAKADHQVHVVVRPGTSVERLSPVLDRISVHRVDLRLDADVAHCLDDVSPDIIYHLASSPRRQPSPHLDDAKAYIREDLGSLVSLLSAAAEQRRPPSHFIRAGSLAEYGAAPLPYREDAREAPATVYGAGMVAATHYVGALQARLPFPVATARLALIYGPAQSTDYLVPALLEKCLAGEASTIRRPDDRRDLLFIADAVEALMRLAAVSLSPAALVNICSGAAPTMREVANLVVHATDADPGLIQYGDGPVSGVADLRGSPVLASELLQWRARTDLASGLEQTVGWYRERALQDQRFKAAAEAEASRLAIGVR